MQDYVNTGRDLEGRRIIMAQIYGCVLLYFLLKALLLMFHPSYQNGGNILSNEKPPIGRGDGGGRGGGVDDFFLKLIIE